MILASVKKLDGTLLDQGHFQSEQAAIEWFQSYIDNGIYGKPAFSYEELVSESIPAVLEAQPVLIKEAVLNEQGDELEPAEFEVQMVEIEPVVPAVYITVHVPAEFIIEFSEISGPSQDEINSESLRYLAETDWYVIRFMETGIEIPEGISEARQDARDKILR